MTWNVNFEIKDGKVDADTVKVVGTPPDGAVSVGGYESDGGSGLNITAKGMSASWYAPKEKAAPVPVIAVPEAAAPEAAVPEAAVPEAAVPEAADPAAAPAPSA